MRESELKEIGRDISQAFKELFSPMGIAFLLSTEVESELEDLYGEDLEKKYSEFKTIGYAKPDFNPQSVDFTDVYGYDSSYRGVLQISRYDLVKSNVGLDLEVLRKSKVKYNGLEYSVIQVIPTVPLGTHFLVYSFIVGDV